MFVFFGIAVCMVGHAVRGDTDLASQDGNKQHSSTFFMMYKFMDDIFAMKEQMSEFKDTMDDQQEEIRQLKYVNDQLESKVNERRPNMGNVCSLHLFDKVIYYLLTYTTRNLIRIKL